MIKFPLSVIGSYPRPISLGKVFSRYRSGKIDKNTLDSEIYKRIKNFLITVQSINVKYTTDGMFRWDDIVDLTFSYLSGPIKGELDRFYDNNFYYRKPVIKNEIKASPEEYIKALRDDINIANEVGFKGILKAVVVGPLTYALLSDNKYYETSDLIHVYSNQVNSVLKSIPSDIKAIEIHEPSLFTKGVKTSILSKLKDAYTELVSGVPQEKHIITYFKVDTSKLDIFFDLPVDVFGIDVIENLNLMAQVYKRIVNRRVFFGVLNSRNTKLERLSTIRRIVEKAREKGATEVLIGNASPMDFIPEVIALRKLKLLKMLGDQ
ncbi:MAG: hypothetical protein QXR57_01705 [Metallosphaera sp.]|uniref:hypothetical protein n=1 Tax=Metallosphaera sp. TaxID=2020860 RepID=UPI003168DBB7